MCIMNYNIGTGNNEYYYYYYPYRYYTYKNYRFYKLFLLNKNAIKTLLKIFWSCKTKLSYQKNVYIVCGYYHDFFKMNSKCVN